MNCMSEDIIKDLSNMDVSDDQWVYECAQRAIHEIERLNAEIARLREALKDARNNGLIYWEPRTERGHVSKAQMLSRIDAALAEEMKRLNEKVNNDPKS